ncbi:hypothetical protein [Streptomyces uncialis]|uniref:hypothetical protein n=1 Tax=Streptomyces uncialis TaxID=1048205 RepID=UPI0038689594|nr:hypothetical protein OG268_01355 [Streptomyces uncialis]
MRRGVAVGAGALAAVMVAAGCSGSGGDREHDKGAGAGEKKPSLAKAATLSVPPGYRPAQGWDEQLPWVPGSVHSLPVHATGKQVAVMHAVSNGYTVRVRDASDGAVAWTSAAWQPPAPLEGAEGDASTGDRAEIPDLSTVTIGGADHFVAWAHGLDGKDELHEGTEVVRLAVYPPDAKGRSVKPLREIDVPVSASPGEIRVDAVDGAEGRFLVGWGDEGLYPQSTAVVDAVTGKVTAHEDPDSLLPQCEQQIVCSGSRVMDLVAGDAPVVAMDGGGFGVPGSWFSKDVRPADVPATFGVLSSANGILYGTSGDLLLAAWHPDPSSMQDPDPVWSVHELRTGKLLASVPCDADLPSARNGDRDYVTTGSPSGRFLFAGPVVLDMERKKGLCLKSDGNPKTVLVNSADDRGTAYGVVEDTAGTETPTTVQLDLTTPAGTPEALEPGTEVPFISDLAGHGVFITRDAGENLLVSLRRRT